MTQAEIGWAMKNAEILLRDNTLLHIHSDAASTMKRFFRGNKVGFRNFIGGVTRHNARLGYNWSVADRVFTPSAAPIYATD